MEVYLVTFSFSQTHKTDTEVFLVHKQAQLYLDRRLRTFCQNYLTISRLNDSVDVSIIPYQDARDPSLLRNNLTSQEICELTRLFMKDNMHWTIENKIVK